MNRTTFLRREKNNYREEKIYYSLFRVNEADLRFLQDALELGISNAKQSNVSNSLRLIGRKETECIG